MLPGLEVRVREAEENLAELGSVEEVGEEFHGVGADAGDVLVESGRSAGGGGGWVLGAERLGFFPHVLCYGGADFEAEDEGLGHLWGEGEKQTTEAAANVCYFDLFGHGWTGWGAVLGVRTGPVVCGVAF